MHSVTSGSRPRITELTERHTARRGVVFDLDLVAGNDLGEGAQSGLYQIVRDALDQAVRRGPPENVVVSILPSDGGVELTIADNGAQERRAAVLAALGERAAELNGTFSSETNASGTRISIRLPPSAARCSPAHSRSSRPAPSRLFTREGSQGTQAKVPRRFRNAAVRCASRPSRPGVRSGRCARWRRRRRADRWPRHRRGTRS